HPSNIYRPESLGVMQFSIVLRRKNLAQKKCPARNRGTRSALSREERAVSAASEGSLAYGFFSRLQWRDRGRFSRPSPLPMPANCELSVCPARNARQTNQALAQKSPDSTRN